MSKKQSVISCIMLFAVTFAVSGFSALLTKDSMKLYPSLTKPPFAPPAIAFPIVWSILFALMSVSAWLILRTLTQFFTVKGALCSPSMLLYFVQLSVNFFWPILFFRFRLYLPAFFWLLLLVFLVTKMILSFWRIHKPSALLQLPYLLWLIFAGYLNLGIWILNR